MSVENPSWSGDYEERIAEAFAYREEAELQADESLAQGDLFGAAMGTFKYAAASLELGDSRDFHNSLLLGTALLEAGIVFEVEKIQPDPLTLEISEKKVDFKIPKYVSFIFEDEQKLMDNTEVIKEDSWAKMCLEHALRKKTLIDAVANAEVVVEAPHLFDADERNKALSEAITAVSDIIFSRHSRYNQYPTLKEEDSNSRMLRVAKKLANEIEIGQSEEADAQAFEAHQKLMLASMYVEGISILGGLNQASRAFRDLEQVDLMNGRPTSELRGRCLENINRINKARRFVLARTPVIPAMQMKESFNPGGSPAEIMSQARTSKATQRWAKAEYSIQYAKL